MIRVIKQPVKIITTCRYCLAELEYERVDIHRRQTGIQEWEYFITCPCCEKEIMVNEGGEVEVLAKELADILMRNPDMKVETTVHILVPEKELEQRGYKYPWDNWNVELNINDIGYSDKVILLGCHIED